MGGTIGTTLKKLRTEKQWTMMQVAQMLGVSLGAYQKYENNTHDVGTETLCKLADLYNVTTDYLLGRAPQTDPMKLLVSQSDLSPEAQEEIYMSLPPEAQAIVLQVMRMMRENRRLRRAAKKPQTVWIKQHQNKAAAGFGYDLSDKDEWYDVEVAETPQTIEADFAVEIDGDSMEPDFHSGDLALIKLDPDVPVGEVGLFVLDGMGYIKERGKKKLISRNPEYPDIEGEARCIGLVIGVAERVS
jgi:transcriptional regulator with XRE-family HTH domain